MAWMLDTGPAARDRSPRAHIFYKQRLDPPIGALQRCAGTAAAGAGGFHLTPCAMRALLLSALVFLTPALLRAQTADEAAARSADRAWLFGVSDDFRLSSFSGAAVAYERLRAGDRATRFSLRLAPVLLAYTDPPGATSQFNARLGLDLGLQFVRYLRGSNNIAFSAGGGPALRFAPDYQRTKQEQGTRDVTLSRFAYAVGGGFTLLGGAHWQVHPNIRVFAEYHNTPQLVYSRARETDAQDRSVSTSQVQASLDSNVLMGVRVALFGD